MPVLQLFEGSRGLLESKLNGGRVLSSAALLDDAAGSSGPSDSASAGAGDNGRTATAAAVAMATRGTPSTSLQGDEANLNSTEANEYPSAASTSTSAGAGAASPPSCKLPAVNTSVFDRSCTLLEDVCVDQGRAILYSEAHRPDHGNGPARGLPELIPIPRQSAYTFIYRGTINADQDVGLPPIHVRPASSREPRPYLAEPSFSNCTIPVVYYSHNSFNHAHNFRDNAARLYSALRETVWSAHIKLVMMTGEGLALPSAYLGLLQPISGLRVDAWGDFTARLPAGQEPGCTGHGSGTGSPATSPQPASYEGGEQRCFKRMYVCLKDLQTDTWQLHAYGKHLVRHYRGEQLVQSQVQQQPPQDLVQKLPPGLQQQAAQLPPPVSVLRQLASAANATTEHLLRIVFQKRDRGIDRKIVNAAQLIDRCNSWQHTTASGARVRALCWEVETPDLASSIAAAQLADIFVGVHGANLASAWLMRPGSSVIELTMYEFEESSAHSQFSQRNLQDADTQIQFWKLMLCDPSMYTPGYKEGKSNGKSFNPNWPKYRNSIVRWQALEAALQAVVDTGGDMQQYRRRFQDGDWWWLSTNDSIVAAGPNLRMTCRKARLQGLI